MALTKISGNVVQQNNFSLSGVVTATSFTGDLTGNVTATTVQVGSATTIHTTGIDLGSGNINSHNINSTGILTATGGFVGAVTGNLSGNVSGTAVTATTASFTNATISGDLTVQGTTTTLDTTLTEVDRLEVGANNTTVGVAITQSGTGDILRLYDSGSQVVTVKDGGLVGIGTDNPSAYFSDANDVVLLKTDDCGITIASGASQKGTIAFADGTTGDQAYRGYIQYNHSTDSLQVATTGTEALRITSTGNIGIGTDTPIGKLHLNYNGNNGISFRMENFEGYSSFHNDGGALYIDSGQHIFRNQDGSSERFCITSGGDVGIGDNAPNSNYGTNLSVHSTATDGARLKLSDGSTGKGNTDGLDIISTGSVAYFINRENADMIFYTNNSERLRIDSNGLIGINNESSPTAHLHIGSLQTGIGNTNIVRIDRGDGTLIYGIDYDGTVNEVVFKGNNKNFVFNNGTSEAETLRLTSEGALNQNGTAGISYFKGSTEYIFGSNTSSPPSGGAEALFQIHQNKTRNTLNVSGYQNNAGGPILAMISSRSETVGTLGSVAQNNDELGAIRFGADGGSSTSVVYGSIIKSVATATATSSGVAADLRFFTSPDSTGTGSQERLRITSSGNVNIPGGILNLGTINTSSAHINSPELMSFNIDTDNDDTNRYFIFKKDASTNAGTELMRLTEGGNLGIGGDPATGDGGNSAYNNWDIPKLYVSGPSTASKFNLMGRFVAGNDSDSTGAQIVIHHQNDRGMALQGGRSSGNRSYGAIKSLDNLARESKVIEFQGGDGAGVEHIDFYVHNTSNSTSNRLRIQDAAECIKVIGETALTGTTGGAKGLTLQTAGGTSCPLYFGSETNSAQKSMYLNGYWIYLRGHQNEGIRFVFSQAGGNAPRSDQYEFKYNSAYRPTGNTTWDGFSDRRAKENIQDVTSALDTIGRLRPVTFDWTNDYADRMNMFNLDKTDPRSYMWTSVKENGYDETRKNNNVGFIAQEFEEVFPNDITETEMQLGDETISDFKTVNFDSLIPMLTKAVQELKAENDSLRARLDAAGL